jgi:sugar/nucleoside kinase (ribokinase family)
LVRGVVGVTLGAEGLLWLEGDREHRAAAPRVSAIDTLAAGDVFHGAFALAIGEGNTVVGAARFANAAAALKCTRLGAASVRRPARKSTNCYASAEQEKGRVAAPFSRKDRVC